MGRGLVRPAIKKLPHGVPPGAVLQSKTYALATADHVSPPHPLIASTSGCPYSHNVLKRRVLSSWLEQTARVPSSWWSSIAISRICGLRKLSATPGALMANAGATTKQKQVTTLSATITGRLINSSNFKMTQVAAFCPPGLYWEFMWQASYLLRESSYYRILRHR